MADTVPEVVPVTPEPPDLLKIVEEAVAKITAEVKADLSDKHLSFTELVTIVEDVVEAVTLAASVFGHGADVEAVIVKAVNDFYNTVLAPLGLAKFGKTIETNVIDPLVHGLIPRLVAMAMNAVKKI